MNSAFTRFTKKLLRQNGLDLKNALKLRQSDKKYLSFDDL